MLAEQLQTEQKIPHTKFKGMEKLKNFGDL
jgi:hypothetical protein